MKKKWLKRKGCKNCALVSIKRYCDDWCDTDCEGHPDEIVVQPYYPDREFVFIRKIYTPLKPISYFKNCYFNEKGNIVSMGVGKLLTPQKE